MVGTRSDRAFSDTHNKRGLVRAFDLTSDKRNDIYLASVTALLSRINGGFIYIYIRWDLVRGDPVRLDVVALIGRGLRSFCHPPPSSQGGGGGGGIGAEAVQILAFHQDTRGPASPSSSLSPLHL